MIWYQESTEKIIKAISENKLVAAFLLLKEAVENNEDFSKYNQQIEELELDFSSLAFGQKKLNKDKVDFTAYYLSIQDRLYTLGCQLEIDERNRQDSTFLALSRRNRELKDADFEETIADMLAEKAMLNLKSKLSPEELAAESTSIERELNIYRNNVFSYLTSLGMLSDEQQLQKIEMLLLSPIIDEHSACLFVTAITLACLNIFDLAKCNLLFDCYMKTSSPSIKARALVGVALCLAVMPQYMIGERSRQWVSQALEKAPSFAKDLEEVQEQLSLSKLSFKKQKKLSTLIMKRLATECVDWSTESEEEGIIGSDNADGKEKWHGFESPVAFKEALEKQGYDPYVGLFSQIKDVAFFHSLSHWFLPFDENLPYVSEIIRKHPKLKETLQVLRSRTNMTDSDIYGLIDLTKHQPDMLEALMPAQEAKDEVFPKTKSINNPLVHYVRVLHRFFLYSSMVESFYNPFTEKLSNHVHMGYCFLGADFYQEQAFKEVREKIADFSFRRGDDHLTLSLLDHLETDTCKYHWMKGVSLSRIADKANRDEAFYHLNRALELKPNDKNVVIDLSILCYQSKFYEEFIKHSQRVVEVLEKSGNGTFNFKKDLIHAYVELERIEDALKICYELNYKYPDDESVRLCLAHCLLRRQVDDVRRQVNKVEAMIDENLKNGYIAFEQRNLDKFKKNATPTELLKCFFTVLESQKEHNPIVDSYNLYNKALCLLARHKKSEALESLFTSLGLVSRSQKDELVDFILKDATKWLAQFGYEKDEVRLIVQVALYKDTQKFKK